MDSALPPPNLIAAANFASRLSAEDKNEPAEAVLRSALENWPGHPELLSRLSLVLLRRGAYAEGFTAYEHRPIHINASLTGKPRLSFPEWTGGPVSSLLVLPEQGLGDQIMFARYLPELRARGVEVTLICHPSLMRLFGDLGVRVLPAAGDLDIQRHDAWVLGPSLPHLMGTTVETVPPARYLPARPTVAGPGRAGIGIMAERRATPAEAVERSLPEALAQELLSWPGAVSLDPKQSGARDFLETAELLGQTRVVVTVDTSVAHLAGAIGKPCIVLLAVGADWRWGDGDRSPWYPEAQLVRQTVSGEWRDVIDTARRLAEATP